MDKRLVFALAAVLAATILGGLISGLDRKLTARFQARKGPPLLQPFYDLLKLLSKKPMAINNWLGPCAAVSALAGATAIGLLVYGAHLLLVVFVQAVGAVFLVLGALSAPSPYSRIGGQRELLQILASEPLILWAVLGLGLAGSGFSVDAILAVKEPLLFSLPLVFVALSLALTIKLRKSPFDTSASHHAHQELVRGVYTEYSGSDLALIELAHWLETV
ncbi:MAG: NADH-quinone oxidoreductase subunit H, partial [Desulfovibrio sp.]